MSLEGLEPGSAVVRCVLGCIPFDELSVFRRVVVVAQGMIGVPDSVGPCVRCEGANLASRALEVINLGRAAEDVVLTGRVLDVAEELERSFLGLLLKHSANDARHRQTIRTGR